MPAAKPAGARGPGNSGGQGLASPWRGFLDLAPDGCLVLEAQSGRILDANPALCDLSGYAQADLVGRSLAEFCPDHAREDILGPLQLMEAAPATRSADWRLRRKDGQAVWLAANLRACRRPAGDYFLVAVRDITRHKQADMALAEQLERTRLQQEVVSTISSSPFIAAGELVEAAREITASAAKAAQVERVGVWLFEEAGRVLRCLDLFEVGTGRHSSGAELLEREYQSEFWALKTSSYVDAHDALTDPRTAGYVAGYLRPLHITSLLDAVIREGGQAAGVLCLEHVDQPHRWAHDEISFACQLADQFAQAMINRKRRLAEDALRASEERYWIAAVKTGQIVYDYDLATGTIRWAGAIQAITGYSEEEFSRFDIQAWSRMIHPDDRAQVLAMLDDSLRNATPFRTEYRLRCRDGNYVDIEDHADYLTGPNRRLARMIGAMKDVTERKRAEAVLRSSEEKFSKAFQTNPALMSISTPDDGRFIDVNEAFLEALGYTRAEVIGRTSAELKIFTEPGQRQAIRHRLQREGVVKGFEVVVRTKPGKLLQGLFSADYIHIQDRPYWLSVMVDITAHQQAREELAAAQALLAAAFEQSPIGFIIADAPDARVRMANQAALEIRAADPATLVGITHEAHQDRWQLHRPDGQPFPPRELPLARAVLEGVTSRNVEVIIRRPNGENRWTLVNATPVRNRDGRIVAGVVIVQDVTERHQLEEQFRQAQKMEAVGRLAGGVAHDFNNLLQTMMGFTDIILMETDPVDPRAQDLKAIKEAAEQAKLLTGQLLAFSRRQVTSPVIFDINQLVIQEEKIIRRMVGEDVHLELNLEPDLWRVRADQNQMQQIILNLVVNARDAMPKGGRLTLTTRNHILAPVDAALRPETRAGHFVTLAVSDTGCGISPQVRQHLFEPFFTTKERGKGTGLGLAMVYGAAKQHEGWVTVYSEVDQGSTFRVYLPAVEVPAAVAPVAPVAVSLPGDDQGHGERVLLIEDDEMVRQLAEKFLRDSGYEVVVAGHVTEALALFRAAPESYHIVVSDVVLPDGNGLDLVLDMMGIKPGLRAILNSGYVDERSRWPEIVQRGWTFIQKPYPMTELLRAVRESLDTPPPA